ncbi:hypothetical protein AN161_10340 [Lysinibacillus sp. FJAT-14222]|nr:hypothetical protein AN161_10340 [Lysinibacillus sp. FJAT-14222]
MLCAKAKRQQQQMFSVATAKRQLQMFSVAKAKRQLQMFYLRESEASAANVLSVRKRSDSNKVPSRFGNQPHVMVLSLFFEIIKFYMLLFATYIKWICKRR